MTDTDHDAPTGANEPGRPHEPPGLQVRARIERPRRNKDGLVLELQPVDQDRTGRLHAFLSGDLIRQIQDATGILLDAVAIVGEHEVTLTFVAELPGNLSAGVAGFVRDAFLTGWAEQDAAVRDGLEADFLWVRQHDLPIPRRLRRVFLIEPDDGGQHPLVDALAHWWDRGAIELIRHPIAFEQLDTVAGLRGAFDCAIDQYEWGSLDLVVVDPGAGFAFRELSDDGLMRQVAVLPVPVITRRASSPTLLDGLAHRCFDHPRRDPGIPRRHPPAGAAAGRPIAARRGRRADRGDPQAQTQGEVATRRAGAAVRLTPPFTVRPAACWPPDHHPIPNDANDTMRHHRFFNATPGGPVPPAHPGEVRPPPVLMDDAEAARPADEVRELRDLLGWLRQRVRGEYTVRASVLTVEPLGSDGHLLLLGEADPSASVEPPRLKVRLAAADFAAFRDATGAALDPAALINRTVVLRLQTALRQRYGRGAGVQARVTAVISVDTVSIDGEIERERTLQRLRREGRRFGPGTWEEPEDPRHIALIAAEFGDALRDVEHVLHPLEDSGLIRLHRIYAMFEGPSAERSLGEAFARAGELHREHGLSATLVCRGGGPVEGFQALNAYATVRAATEAPNVIAGLCHAGTPLTALDAVAARSEPTPTAAAMLVRRLVEATGVRAERVLAAYDTALAEDLEAAGRIALAWASQGFDQGLRELADLADRRLRQLDLGVERSLLAGLAAASGMATGARDEIEPHATPVEVLDFGDGDDDDDPPWESGWALVTAADTGLVIERYRELKSNMPLFLHFRDGTIFVRVVPTFVTYN